MMDKNSMTQSRCKQLEKKNVLHMYKILPVPLYSKKLVQRGKVLVELKEVEVS